MSALTDLITTVPPRIGHAVSQLLGLSAAHAIFCKHCPEWAGFGSDAVDQDDDLDALFTPEERAEVEAWDADAYRVSVEVPTSKITDAQLDDLYDRVSDVVDEWAGGLPERDWDPFLYGHGPAHRKPDPT